MSGGHANSQVGSLKQRLPGAAASSQLLWRGTSFTNPVSPLAKNHPRTARLGEMLPNDSTLEVGIRFAVGETSLHRCDQDWFIEPGLVMLNVVSSQKAPSNPSLIAHRFAAPGSSRCGAFGRSPRCGTSFLVPAKAVLSRKLQRLQLLAMQQEASGSGIPPTQRRRSTEKAIKRATWSLTSEVLDMTPLVQSAILVGYHQVIKEVFL